jgi:hypothetical protein
MRVPSAFLTRGRGIALLDLPHLFVEVLARAAKILVYGHKGLQEKPPPFPLQQERRRQGIRWAYLMP